MESITTALLFCTGVKCEHCVKCENANTSVCTNILTRAHLVHKRSSDRASQNITSVGPEVGRTVMTEHFALLVDTTPCILQA